MGESVIVMMMGSVAFFGPGVGERRLYIHILQITTIYY